MAQSYTSLQAGPFKTPQIMGNILPATQRYVACTDT
jgi:hypothetical protein